MVIISNNMPKRICECALNFSKFLDAIDGVDDIAETYYREKSRGELNEKEQEAIKERLLIEVKRVGKSIERTNESCNIKLGDKGLLAPLKYRIEHDEPPERIYSLTEKLKNEILADLTIQCK